MVMISFPTLSKLYEELELSRNLLLPFIISVSTYETYCEGLHHARHLPKTELKNGPWQVSLQSKRSMKQNTWVQIWGGIIKEACLLGMSAKVIEKWQKEENEAMKSKKVQLFVHKDLAFKISG